MAEEARRQAEEPEVTANAVNLADIVDDAEVVEDEFEDDGIDTALEGVLAASDDPAEDGEDDEDEESEDDYAGDAESGSLDDIMGDIFAEEMEDDDRMKAFGDLEHLTMVEVAAEVEAVLEELRIRQGEDD